MTGSLDGTTERSGRALPAQRPRSFATFPAGNFRDDPDPQLARRREDVPLDEATGERVLDLDRGHHHPPYYHFGQEETNVAEFGPQNSRGFRALEVWLALRHVGRAVYVHMIGDDVRLSERLHARLSAHAELEPVTQALSITTFGYVLAELSATVGSVEGDAYLDALNEALLERIQQSGEAFVSNAVVRGRYVLRACIVNFNTEARDVDALAEIVVRLGRETHVAPAPSPALSAIPRRRC